MISKEDDILKLFLNNPTKEWHFEELLVSAKISRSKATGWLRGFVQKGYVEKIKEKGSMPYYTANIESPAFRNRKRIFALNKLYESGLLDHLCALPEAKSIILFGSFARSDWYHNSDIDIFIFGSPTGLNIAEFELKLHRDIQVFVSKDNNDLENLGDGLLRNIIRGNVIKGDLNFVEVNVNA